MQLAYVLAAFFIVHFSSVLLCTFQAFYCALFRQIIMHFSEIGEKVQYNALARTAGNTQAARASANEL